MNSNLDESAKRSHSQSARAHRAALPAVTRSQDLLEVAVQLARRTGLKPLRVLDCIRAMNHQGEVLVFRDADQPSGWRIVPGPFPAKGGAR